MESLAFPLPKIDNKGESNMEKQNKTKRIIVHITEYESRLIDALIKEHLAESGMHLSRSSFVRIHLNSSFKTARDYLVIEGEE